MSTSGSPIPAAVTWMRIWPGAGSGGSRVTECRTSVGSPLACTCQARISAPSIWLGKPDRPPDPDMVRNRPQRSLAFEDPRCAVEQQVDLVPEDLVQRIVGEPAPILGVAALEDDGQLPSGEHVVPTDCRNVAARSQGVSLNQGVAVGEVINGKLRIFRSPERHGSFRPRVEDEGPGKIDQGVANRRHLPIAHSEQLGWWIRGEQDVVELVVTVAQSARLGNGTMLPEPGGDSTDTGQVAAAVAVELGEPTGQLSGQVVTGVGQIAQPTCLPVHGMDRRQGIDELVERRSVRLRCGGPAGRHGGADGRSGNAVHDVEGCLEDVDVATRQNGPS